MSFFTTTDKNSQTTSLGASFSSSLQATRWRQSTQEEESVHYARFGRWSPESLNWEEDVSNISSGTDTHFGSDEDNQTTSDRPVALSSGSEESEPENRVRMGRQFPAFWPSKGTQKARAKIAKELEEGVIHKLPSSAHPALPCRTEMSKNDIRLRIKELFGVEGKSIQVDTIWRVACRQESMILVAKTGIGKSLIFEAIPLLDPADPGIALIVMPLKHIQQQQLAKINQIPGARAAVYDGDHNDERLRYAIAAGHFTHSQSSFAFQICSPFMAYPL